MTELFTAAHRETLSDVRTARYQELRFGAQLSKNFLIAVDAALAEIDRLRAMLDLAESALPDSMTAGPNGTGYKYAWDELDSDEQEWVKDIRHRMRGEP